MKEENIYYIALKWFDENPILDGCKAFKKKEDALKYIDKNKETFGFNIRWTIPRVEIITT